MPHIILYIRVKRHEIIDISTVGWFEKIGYSIREVYTARLKKSPSENFIR